MRRTAVEEARARAETFFRKPHEHEAAEAATKQATEAEHMAVLARTAQLREMRLAKEKADRTVAKAAGLDEGNEPKRGPTPHIKHAVVNGRTMRYTTKVRDVEIGLTVDQQPNKVWLAQGDYGRHTLEATAQSATAAVKRWREIAEFCSGGPGHRRFAGFLKPDGKP